MNQRRLQQGQSFVALVENNEFALVNKVVSNQLTKNVWIGDTGASCHMKMNMEGMYNMCNKCR